MFSWGLAKLNCSPHKYLWFNGRKCAHSGNDNSGTGIGLYTVAWGILVSHLRQSKNSEVLNTFHPNSGRGFTMPLEKVWRNSWCVNSSGWFYCESLCVQGCYCHASRTERQGVGALGIIYWGSRRNGGQRWQDVRDLLCCCICGLTKSTNTNMEKMEHSANDCACITVRTNARNESSTHC